MPTIILTSGPRAGERIELTGELIVGRENADLTLDDPEISRRHAAIRLRDGAVEVEDLNSTNGTLVDGVRITAPVMLDAAARLEIGETAIEIEVERPVDDGATRLHQSPAAPDLTMMRPTPTAPPPEATTAYARPAAAEHEQAPGGAPQAEPAARIAPVPPAAPAPAAGPAGSAAAAQAQPFGAFAPSSGRGRRRKQAATRLWIPTMMTFAIVAGTAVALILYFAGR